MVLMLSIDYQLQYYQWYISQLLLYISRLWSTVSLCKNVLLKHTLT